MSSRPWGRPGYCNPCIDRPRAGRRGRCGHRSIRRKSFFVDPCRGGGGPPPPPRYDFPDFDENSIATTFYTTGTTGN
ncbi:hypothetical protein ABMZ29_29475, partial [Pseudomonas aeruginosa]